MLKYIIETPAALIFLSLKSFWWENSTRGFRRSNTEKYQRRQKRISPGVKINFQRLKDITEGWKLSLEVEISHFGLVSILLWIYRFGAYRSFACYGLFIHTPPDWRHILKSQGQTKKKKRKQEKHCQRPYEPRLWLRIL